MEFLFLLNHISESVTIPVAEEQRRKDMLTYLNDHFFSQEKSEAKRIQTDSFINSSMW